MRPALRLLIALLCVPLLFGQRSKPAEIALRDGAGSAEGRLRGRQQRTYSVTAAAGQTLTIEMASEPMRSVVLEVYDPEGQRLFLQKEAAARWVTPAHKTGSYSVAVVRNIASAPTSSYRLRISIH